MFHRYDFPLLNKTQIKDVLHNDAFDLEEFDRHVKEVAFKTKIDEEIVRSVIESYFTNIVLVINSVRKLKTKINVYGFLTLFVEKGKRLKIKNYE